MNRAVHWTRCTRRSGRLQLPRSCTRLLMALTVICLVDGCVSSPPRQSATQCRDTSRSPHRFVQLAEMWILTLHKRFNFFFVASVKPSTQISQGGNLFLRDWFALGPNAFGNSKKCAYAFVAQARPEVRIGEILVLVEAVRRVKNT